MGATYDERVDRKTTVRLPRTLREQVETRARESRRTVSDVVRLALEKGLPQVRSA